MPVRHVRWPAELAPLLLVLVRTSPPGAGPTTRATKKIATGSPRDHLGGVRFLAQSTELSRGRIRVALRLAVAVQLRTVTTTTYPAMTLAPAWEA